MTEFRMPALGADMEAGTLVQWLKAPGDAVTRGDVIAVVETEKGAIEIEVFADGVIDRVLVPPGQKVPVGTPLAMIRAAGEAATESVSAQSAATASPRPTARASPAARRAAESLGVDLSSVTGTGPGGAITRDDVERAASRRRIPAATPAASAPGKTATMRSAIAAAMARSKREIPHVYLSGTTDMTTAIQWLEATNETVAVDHRVLPIALFVKAVAKAAVAIPEVNGYFRDGGFCPGSGIHVGCAIALRDRGLVAPAVHDADQKSVSTLMSELMDLVARARSGTLRSSELADATITVTNLGDLGVEQAFAVVYPPQVAIVAVGRMMVRPWVVDGRIEPRPLTSVTLSADHRVVDGRRGGQFLAAIDRLLQKPEQL